MAFFRGSLSLFYIAGILLIRAEFSHQDGYTFRELGKSYVEYHPQWRHFTAVELRMSFRTLMRTTFLAHHTLMEAGSEGYRPHVWIRLKEGELQVTHELGDDTDTLSVGRGLNHNQWHEVVVALHMTSANISVTLNRIEFNSRTLQSLLTDLNSASTIVDKTGIFSVGGFSPESLQTPSRFIGCIQGVSFIEDGRGLMSRVVSKDGVERGCVDHCQTDNPCIHHGECVNLFTSTVCDCYGTGYEGQYCDTDGMTSVTLQGSEWVSYIEPERDARTHKSANRVAFQFKTSSSQGVLFYAREQYPQYNHLAASLNNATLHISVVFVDQLTYNELFVSMGAGLNDNRWHAVTIIHEGQQVRVQLDSDIERMTADHNNPHLRFPAAVYYGGIEVTSQALGLKSHSGFVGCLRGLYLNRVSVLERLDTPESSTTFHGTNNIRFGCQSLDNASLQFTHDGAFTRIEHTRARVLSIELHFRTLKGNEVLVYTEVSSEQSMGYLQVMLRHGRLVVDLVPSSFDDKQRVSLESGNFLNDNKWHTLKLTLSPRILEVFVDYGFAMDTIDHIITTGEASYVGFGPNTAVDSGFIGCMKNVKIQDVVFDPVKVVHSDLSAGVTLGNCDLVDWCTGPNATRCHHNGQCVSLWNEEHCDCISTHYAGRNCQFSRLKHSCSELYQSGVSESGVYQLDVDGPGPLLPILVYCDMTSQYLGVNQSAVRIDHNLQPGTLVRDPTFIDMKKIITYREATAEHMRAIVLHARTCQQSFQVNCYDAALLGGRDSLFSSAAGLKHILMSPKTMPCDCGELNTCRNARAQCNCQEKTSVWGRDSGYLTDKAHLPVTEMFFLQKNGGIANVTLGPLVCYGDESQREDSIVMFTTADSYLELPGWEGGPLKFMFRSTSSTGYLVYQAETQVHTRRGRVQLMITMHNKRFLTIQMSRPQLIETVRADGDINTGSWQHFSMELLLGQLHVRLNGNDFIFDADGEAGPGQDATSLFIGGKPRIGSSFSGIVGCFGGLLYNGRSHALTKLVKKGAHGLSPTCVAACDSSRCENGGECEEQWSEYSCRCLNMYAQSGQRCQQDINSDIVTFHKGSSSIHLLHDTHLGADDFFNSKVILSFRTSRQRALVFYAHDHVNNFLLIAVGGREELMIGYNEGTDIHTLNITIPNLTDGSWKQFALVQSAVDGWVVHVDSVRTILTRHRFTTNEYIQVPFFQGEVLPPDRFSARFYLGNVPEPYHSSFPGFKGCMRGLKIGLTSFSLSTDASIQTSQGVTVGCTSPCLSSPCLNGGWCVDEEDGIQYNCECSNTGYSGPQCNKELGLYFDGQSMLLELLNTRTPDDSDDVSAEIHLSFHVTTKTSHTSPVTLALLIGKDNPDDFVLVWMSTRGEIAANVSVDHSQVSLEPAIHYDDGSSHRVSLSIVERTVSLKTDDYVTERTLPEAARFEAPSWLVVGGPWVQQFANMDHFNGDISNVFLLSTSLEPVNARPIDVYYGYPDGNHGVTVVGQVGPPSHQIQSSAQYRRSHHSDMTSERPLNFPPWDQGPAETVPLVQSTPADTADTSTGSMTLIIGILVGLALLVCIAVALAVFILRKKCKSGTFTPVPPAGDEEEGLLRPGSIIPTEKDDKNKTDNMPTAKLRQGPKSKKKAAMEGALSDDDNEESPMLPENSSEPTPNKPGPVEEIALKPFGESLSASVPMIDAVGNEEDDEEIIKKPTLRPVGNGKSDQRPASVELKKELRKPRAVFDPSPGNTSTPYKKDDIPMRTSRGRKSSPPSSRPNSLPLGSSPTNSIGNLPSEVWTESQILDIIENDQDEVAADDDTPSPPSDRTPDSSLSKNNTLHVRGTNASCTEGVNLHPANTSPAGHSLPGTDSSMETFNTANERPTESMRDSEFMSLSGSTSQETLKGSSEDANRLSPVKNGSLNRGSHSASTSPSMHLKRGSRMRDTLKDDDSEPEEDGKRLPIRVTADVHSPSSESAMGKTDFTSSPANAVKSINGPSKDVDFKANGCDHRPTLPSSH